MAGYLGGHIRDGLSIFERLTMTTDDGANKRHTGPAAAASSFNTVDKEIMGVSLIRLDASATDLGPLFLRVGARSGGDGFHALPTYATTRARGL